MITISLFQRQFNLHENHIKRHCQQTILHVKTIPVNIFYHMMSNLVLTLSAAYFDPRDPCMLICIIFKSLSHNNNTMAMNMMNELYINMNMQNKQQKKGEKHWLVLTICIVSTVTNITECIYTMKNIFSNFFIFYIVFQCLSALLSKFTLHSRKLFLRHKMPPNYWNRPWNCYSRWPGKAWGLTQQISHLLRVKPK